jgi:hypothetical protein
MVGADLVRHRSVPSIIGTSIYAIRAMPELPRIDRVVWISAIVVTATVLLIASAIQ